MFQAILTHLRNSVCDAVPSGVADAISTLKIGDGQPVEDDGETRLTATLAAIETTATELPAKPRKK
jgi:hypothetical protein